jgi:hypothetical protein
MGIAKMQADRSRVSTVVTLLSYISSFTLSIKLSAYHYLFYLYSASGRKADGILFPAIRQYLFVADNPKRRMTECQKLYHIDKYFRWKE